MEKHLDNNAKRMPNYGSCLRDTKNENDIGERTMHQVKTKNIDYNDKINVIDAYRMRRMFQCDPSQLPAEDQVALIETSSTILTTSKSLPLDTELSLCKKCGQSERSVINLKVENQESIGIDNRKSELSRYQSGNDALETPQIEICQARNDKTVDVDDHFEQTQRETSSEGMKFQWNEASSSTKTANEENLDLPRCPSNSFSEYSLEQNGQYDEIITLELSALDDAHVNDTKSNAKRYNRRNSETFLSDTSTVIRSKTAHKFEHWSSESEDATVNDIYQKLSEVEDEASQEGDLSNIDNLENNQLQYRHLKKSSTSSIT